MKKLAGRPTNFLNNRSKGKEPFENFAISEWLFLIKGLMSQPHGGKLQKVRYISTFKRSCVKLKPYIENLSYGVWQLNFRKQYIENAAKIKTNR